MSESNDLLNEIREGDREATNGGHYVGPEHRDEAERLVDEGKVVRMRNPAGVSPQYVPMDSDQYTRERLEGLRAKQSERYEPCEECGEPVDTLQSGIWKAPNDEQWWHEGCFDKVEKAEELATEIRALMVPEDKFDGLSNEFHDRLDNAQAEIETAVEREQLKRDQGIGPHAHK